jgi:hypothetical protein
MFGKYEKENVYRNFIGKSEGKTPLGRTQRRWKGDIKVGLNEIIHKAADWINVTTAVLSVVK